MDLLDQLQPEHLDGEQRKLADAIGIEAFKTLVKMYAGCVVYIPTVDKLTIKVRDSQIKSEYTGYNQRDLAIRYGISEQWVRVIVGAAMPPIEGQVSLFDDTSAAV
jgi:Mor family transcriptional regulator